MSKPFEIKPIILDAVPLIQLLHPRLYPEIKAWVSKLLQSDFLLVIPAIVDYQVRCYLTRENLSLSIQRLDSLKTIFYYLSIDDSMLMKAAVLSAQVSNSGVNSSKKDLDFAAILAAQALVLDERFSSKSVIATTNAKCLSTFIDARIWQDI